jgi:aminoglycoside phosphotransferase (APT) family kinase protein
MMKHPAGTIHGHTLEEIQNLLHDSCEYIQKDVVLSSTLLGGWSNINLRGYSQGLEFVLKVPCSTMHNDMNPYSKLYALLTYLSKAKLTAPPIAYGRFSDKNETPYIVLPHIRGTPYPSIHDATQEELQALKDALHQLSIQKPPGPRKYKTPFDYLIDVNCAISRHEPLSDFSKEVVTIIHAFEKQFTKLSPYAEALGTWRGTVMHGDLWEPNILFHDGEVTLLDFESCSYGDPVYDLAYLLEASDRDPVENLPSILSSNDRDLVRSYRPIALMALVSWSLERLLSMEAKQIDNVLNTAEIRDTVVRYTNAKITRLTFLTN